MLNLRLKKESESSNQALTTLNFKHIESDLFHENSFSAISKAFPYTMPQLKKSDYNMKSMFMKK